MDGRIRSSTPIFRKFCRRTPGIHRHSSSASQPLISWRYPKANNHPTSYHIGITIREGIITNIFSSLPIFSVSRTKIKRRNNFTVSKSLFPAFAFSGEASRMMAWHICSFGFSPFLFFLFLFFTSLTQNSITRQFYDICIHSPSQ